MDDEKRLSPPPQDSAELSSLPLQSPFQEAAGRMIEFCRRPLLLDKRWGGFYLQNIASDSRAPGLEAIRLAYVFLTRFTRLLAKISSPLKALGVLCFSEIKMIASGDHRHSDGL